MSSGNVHIKASFLLSAGFSIGAMFYDPRLLVCAEGALVGIFLSPDLDVDKTYIGDKLIEQKAGWIGRRIWVGFWRSYKTSFKHGRFASHFPIFGTFTRLSYIYFWLIFIPHTLIYLLLNPNWNLIYVLEWYGRLFLNFWFFYGLASSDLIHFFLDLLTKEQEKVV